MQLAADEVVSEDTINTSLAVTDRARSVVKTPEELANIVSLYAASDGWMGRVRLRNDHRWYERLYQGPGHDIWAISWMPGQSTGFHDHGDSAGAFVLATGVLEEHRPGHQPLVIHPGEPRAFDSDYAHDVRNVSLAPAVSIHAYSPPLRDMNEYELDGNELVPRDNSSERTQNLEEQRRVQKVRATTSNGALGIEQMLSTARARLRRLSPEQALKSVAEKGAILVDIRPEAQRNVEGRIPGALIIERNVLEWRFDPCSNARLSIANDHEIRVIVFCSEGYTSSLAAAALQDLGLWRATDIVGGFQAWRTKKIPIVPPDDPTR